MLKTTLCEKLLASLLHPAVVEHFRARRIEATAPVKGEIINLVADKGRHVAETWGDRRVLRRTRFGRRQLSDAHLWAPQRRTDRSPGADAGKASNALSASHRIIEPWRVMPAILPPRRGALGGPRCRLRHPI